MNILVIGRGKGVWEEIEQAKRLCAFDQVVAINRIGVDYPDKINHWASFHANRFFAKIVMRGGFQIDDSDWVRLRRAKGYPDADYYWTSTKTAYRIGNSPLRTVECEGGSSGLIGVMVALYVGGTRVVLAGIPMAQEYEHYDHPGPWIEAKDYRKAWLDVLPKLRNVRSMSGWTKELLGAPTEDWLAK